jgi:hypothetical protein
MNPAFRLILVFFAFVLAAQEVAAEEWRGLKPLSSTKADVVRLFGECAHEERWCEFTLDNEDVFIEFSTPQTCAGISPGTVLLIQRELQKATTIERLQIDKRRFKSFDPSLPRNQGYRGFINEASGLLFKTFSGEVFEINYIAAKNDWKVCPGYFRRPRELLRVIFPHVPVVTSVGCPETSPITGQKIVIRANYPRTGQRFLLTWEVKDGRILERQGVRRILIDTTGQAGKTIKVTVEINDDSGHTAIGSCTFKVSPKPDN